MTDVRRTVPRTDTVLADPRLQAATQTLGAAHIKAVVRRQQERVRSGELHADELADAVLAAISAPATTMTPVINATGVVLHTNLGRAPLSAAAVDALVRAAGYVDVEFDLATGQRAARGRGTLDALRAAVPAAGDALVVNNGAAALVLAATALAQGKEIVVSRGELVEIGDGFRLPDLLTSTGARLCEVGTTNRTTLEDYAAAVGPETGFVLKVHPSNFRIEGFTSAVGIAEIASLGHPVVADIGSGLLAPDAALPDEPDALTALSDGAQLVTASGDKLLGGPQAGLLLGRAEVIARLRRHPLARALRVDKLTLAALEATLRGGQSPTGASLHANQHALLTRAESLAKTLSSSGISASVIASDGVVGGGGAPGHTLPGWAIAVPEFLAAALRAGDPPVIARVEGGQCLIDLRCVSDDDDDRLAAAIVAAHSDT